MLTIFWPKFILAILVTFYYTNKIYKRTQNKNSKLSKEDIDFIISGAKFWTKIFIKICGGFIDFKRLPDEKVLPVYKKYFGPDYKIDYDGKFGCYISNHTCIYDMGLAMSYFGTGFVSKEGIKKVPLFGKMNIALQAILVKRSSSGSKNDVLDIIGERQKAYFEGKAVMPFLIFPEGTTTSGRHILKFKKGAFNSLLPIKATFIHTNLNNNYHLGCGSTDVGMNFLRSLAELYFKLEYVELPIMTPNEYMYKNFSHFGKEKWEIYAEVAREIMCELGDFKKTDFGLRDSFRYCSCIAKKTLLDRSTYKIE